MIFSASKGMYHKVLLGEKPLTTRLKLPAHIRVGAEWAIVPRRAAPAWWFMPDCAAMPIITNVRRDFYPFFGEWYRDQSVDYSYMVKRFSQYGYVQARIRIDDFWTSPLGEMTEAEAREDGAESVKDYAALWTSINPQYEWYSHLDLPVYRIRFSVPPDVAQAVSRVGRQAILDAANVEAVGK